MLEELNVISIVKLSFDLSHKGHWYVGHEKDGVDSRPRGLAVQFSWVWPYVGARALYQYSSIWQELATLEVPIIDHRNIVLLLRQHSAISREVLAEHIR